MIVFNRPKKMEQMISIQLLRLKTNLNEEKNIQKQKKIILDQIKLTQKNKLKNKKKKIHKELKIITTRI